MVVSTIQSQISKSDLTLRPGYSAATLDVDVVNNSDRQASFHILLTATGASEQSDRRWYHITPMTSSKVPPGTHSRYTVNIVDTPLADFVGLANVTVRIISPELQSEERHILRLRVEPGIDRVPFKVELNTPNLQDYPGQVVEITARIHNTSRYSLTVDLSCPGIEDWIADSSPKQLKLRPNRWHDILMICQIPEDLSVSHSRNYPFQLLAVDDDDHAATADGSLEVLPMGYFELMAEHTQLAIPDPPKWLPDRQATFTQVQLQINNHSNLKDAIRIRAIAPFSEGQNPSLSEQPSEQQATDAQTADGQAGNPADSAAALVGASHDKTPPYQVTLTPDEISLAPGETGWVDADIEVKRPWIGWVKLLLIDVQARSENAFLELRNDTETLQVKVAPIIPRWLQAVLLLLLGGAVSGLWYLQTYRQHHHQLVSSVQFNGTGSRVISGSSDQTLRQWEVRRHRLRAANGRLNLDKAVRVLRFRPVDNNQLAVGLENGEIQLWDLLKSPKQEPRTLISPPGQPQSQPQSQSSGDRDDRVMALAPTADARYLFSGYGSGQVAQWYIGPGSSSADATEPTRQRFIPELAINDIALVDPAGETLAIAGRYNKLLLWPWSKEDSGGGSGLVSVNYPDGGQDDYITSLATAEQQPFRLVTADNQGRITLWDLAKCIDGNDACTVLDQWEVQGNTAIRSIALSANGCYLASASDTGQLTLWPLTRQGRRLTKYLQGQPVRTLKSRLNSVDIKVLESSILIVSGAEDRRVRLNRLKHLQQTCQE